MAIKRMPIGQFVAECEAALNRKDGYIMGARGQNPRTGNLNLAATKVESGWGENGYYYVQYSGKQRTKALEWRKTATRVWDCNGMAEGIYQIWSGVNINTKARYNYSGWCSTKGTGMIPAKYRKPGAAVFWSEGKASKIHHVAYLYKPVDANKPSGDWYIIEAHGVMRGVIKSKLHTRKPNFWGIMDKYFDYGDADFVPASPQLGERVLRNGMEGDDVKELQEALIELGYSCGKWGADGSFGDATEMAVEKFQKDHGCAVDGSYGPESDKAMQAAQKAAEAPQNPRAVKIKGGDCWARSAPNTSGNRLGVAREGDKYNYGGQTAANGWYLIEYKGQNAWVSGKYGKLED